MNERTAFIMIASNVYGHSRAASLPLGEITKLPDASVHRPEIGFRAEAYRIEETGEIVVAIAGTNTTNWQSLLNAARIGRGVLPEQQIAAAEAFVRDVTTMYGDSVTLVGHSSGGLVAQLVAAKQESEPLEDRLAIDRAIGFNSPGAAPFLPAIFGTNIPASFENIEGVCDSRDIVCRLFDTRDGSGGGMGDSHIGSVEYINPVHSSEPLYGWDLVNPFNGPQIFSDIVQFHGITHLLRLHAESLPLPIPVEVADELSGPLGLGVVTIQGVEAGAEPSPFEEGASEFNTFQTSSPLVLDLDGDGVETQGLLAGAFFDHAGDGFAELTGWIGADDGLLVLDRNGNGTVDHGGELFGNETLLPDGTKAGDGYEALAQLDQNADGKVDAGDPVWSRLRVWRDADGNGDSETSELHALAHVGVAAIGTAATPSTFIDTNGNEHRLVGALTRSDASAGATADVWFRVARRHGVADEQLPVPGHIAALPSIQGYGTVHDLHQAMVRDADGALTALVQQFVAEAEPSQRTALLDQILFRWTGSDGIDPGSRGPHIDARRLATLERVYGDAFIGIEGTGNPNAEVGGLLDHTYQGLAEMVYAQLTVQSHLADLWMSSAYVWDAATEKVRGDLSDVSAELRDFLSADPAAGRVALGEFARTIRGLGVEAMVDYQAFRDTFAAQGEDIAWLMDSGGKILVAGAAGDDTLTGLATADALLGGSGNDTLSGDEGDDVLYGQAGNDSLNGGAEDDVLDGGGGSDSLDGRRGNDRLSGGADDDTLLGAAGDDVLAGGDGSDSLDGGEGNDVLLGGAGADTLLGREQDDRLLGGEGDDSLTGNRGADVLAGEAGNDTLSGEGGPDALDGGAGNDHLDGGTENDIYHFGRGGGQDVIVDRDSTPSNADVIVLAADIAPGDVQARREGDDLVLALHATSDRLRVTSWFSEAVPGQYEVEEVRFASGTVWDREALRQLVIVPTEGPDSLTGYTTADALHGLGGDDTLAGRGGDDSLDGGAGNDSLMGDAGNDTLLGGPGPDLLGGNEGHDILRGGDGDDVLSGDRDDDILAGDAGNDSLLGGGGLDSLDGGAGNDVLDGGDDSDSLEGGPGDDSLLGGDDHDILGGGPGADALGGNAGNDALYGGPDDDVLSGDRDHDTLVGEAGNDRLDGGPGVDAMAGGPGDDTYVVDDAGDTLAESAAEGTDAVETSVTHTLPANVENLTLTGTGAINATGNALNNRLTGNGGANTVSGGAGDDTLEGDAGADTLVGGTGADVMAGGAGDDVLDGGAGLDRLAGGVGHDTYVVGEAGDVVIELAGEGTDLVESSVNFTLPAHVEALALTASAAINGTGNALNNNLTGNVGRNTLTGGAGDDLLDGGGGADRLVGGTGNDAYIVAETGDVVTESNNQGIDTVESSVTYVLPSHVERLRLTGTGAIDGTGNALANTLTGNAAANRLIGGGGIDAMAGGPGDDTYVIDSLAETVTEGVNEGIDTIETALTYVLSANVERLTLTGSGAINATGNALNNTLTGNTKSNVLDGKAGADAMAGGAGNDAYVVDNVADTVTEAVNSGTDTIESSVSYALPDHVEKLALMGAAAIDGTGNALNNTLTGNGGANRLDGGPGTDTMAGGAGDDTYVADRTADILQETANAGIDTVLSSTTYFLPAHVENLTLTGTEAVGATGNALGNVLQGNGAANFLDGRAGNDTYIFARGAGQDTLQDIDLTPGNVDTLAFAADVDPLDLIISRHSNGLRVAVHGAADRVDVQTWYNGEANQIEVFRAGDGRQLLSTQVEQLIQAMASYSAQSGLTWDHAVAQRPEEVEAILAVHWQPAGS